jgi:glycosyltransferase involved in cell wall biosynthesis
VYTIASTIAANGGTSRSITGLCSAVAAAGGNIRLVSADPPDAAVLRPSTAVETILTGRGPLTRIGPFGSDFHAALRDQLNRRRPAILHDNGAWLWTNITASHIARTSGIPLVISTRGTFSSWALRRRRLKKRVAWWVYQRAVLASAALLHATSAAEAEDLRRVGAEQPIAVIPNGIELPELDRCVKSGRRALFLGRLHPVKGLPLLLEAWAAVRPAEWVLEIAGPCDGDYASRLRDLVRELGLTDVVEFTGEQSEADKWRRFAMADLLVAPSHSENFGLSIAEALASAVPVVTTTGTPWSQIEATGCGWWVAPTVAAISTALADAVAVPPVILRTMGLRGRALVESTLSWGRIAEQMLGVYQWVALGGERPSCVLLSKAR